MRDVTEPAPAAAVRREPNALVLLAIEFLPLLAFFVANQPLGIFVATGVFMGATAVCLILSVLLARRVSPILLFNAVLVAVFGGLTLVLHDSVFIKVKPTVDYAMFGAVLLFGLFTDRLFLRNALGMTFSELGTRQWRVLTRNWAMFFMGMAIANEVAWRTVSTDNWVAFRTWVPMLATSLFGLAHVPYLLASEDQAAGQTDG